MLIFKDLGRAAKIPRIGTAGAIAKAAVVGCNSSFQPERVLIEERG
jgi:hypothetical protein